MSSNILVEAIRGTLQEKRFFGWVCVVGKNKKVLKSLHEKDYMCFMRSCAKPLQAFCAFESGAVSNFNFNRKEIAIGASSHSGGKYHVEVLEGMLKKISLTEEDLLCGTHLPLDETEKIRLIRENIHSSMLHHNCSGKHVFALAACLAYGWDYSNYTDFEHPLQKRMAEVVQHYCRPVDYHRAIDGCGMPVHGMLLTEMTAGFAKYFDGSTPVAEVIADAVTENPEYIGGGMDRIDSMIIKATGGKLIAKVGAEGLIIITPRHSGEALVIKMASGDNNMRDYVVIEALKQLGWLENIIPEENENLKRFTKLDVYSTSNQLSGYYHFTFRL